MGRFMGEFRERCAVLCSVNHLRGAFRLGFLWPIVPFCLILSLYLVYLRVLPLCVKEAYG